MDYESALARVIDDVVEPGAAAVDRDGIYPRAQLDRSEEHTSELQSPCNLVCRLLLENKKRKVKYIRSSIRKIGFSNPQCFVGFMTQILTLSHISHEPQNYLATAGITTACLQIKSERT